MKVKKSAPKLSPSQRKKWLAVLQSSAEHAAHGISGSRLRLVIDSNIWISGILFGGWPARVIEHALERQEVIVSDYIVEEVIEGLKRIYPKLPHKWVRLLRQQLMPLVRDDDFASNVVIRDIRDEPIVRLATKYSAIVLTGDNDIIAQPPTRLPVLTVAEYGELFLIA